MKQQLKKDFGMGQLITIRLLDLYAAMMNATFIEDSLDEMLYQKMEVNNSRPLLHGNLF